MVFHEPVGLAWASAAALPSSAPASTVTRAAMMAARATRRGAVKCIGISSSGWCAPWQRGYANLLAIGSRRNRVAVFAYAPKQGWPLTGNRRGCWWRAYFAMQQKCLPAALEAIL
jgi:hypothetical protein